MSVLVPRSDKLPSLEIRYDLTDPIDYLSRSFSTTTFKLGHLMDRKLSEYSKSPQSNQSSRFRWHGSSGSMMHFSNLYERYASPEMGSDFGLLPNIN